MSEKRVLLEKGKLPIGKDCYPGESYEIFESRKSSVSQGRHIILEVVKKDGRSFKHEILTLEEKSQALAKMIVFCQKNSFVPGKWNIELNGPGMGTVNSFHIHGRLPLVKGQIIRSVWNPSEFLEKLVAARNMDEVQAITKELKANLK